MSTRLRIDDMASSDCPAPLPGKPPAMLDVEQIRRHFEFPATGRVVTNNAASTQPPREPLGLYRSLAPWYENVHRGQSSASQRMTAMFEESYDTIAAWNGYSTTPCRSSTAGT